MKVAAIGNNSRNKNTKHKHSADLSRIGPWSKSSFCVFFDRFSCGEEAKHINKIARNYRTMPGSSRKNATKTNAVAETSFSLQRPRHHLESRRIMYTADSDLSGYYRTTRAAMRCDVI